MGTFYFGITSIPLKHKKITSLLCDGHEVLIGKRGETLYKISLMSPDKAAEEKGARARAVDAKVEALLGGNRPG